ncbi:Thioredoxin [Dissophora globulifera]|uniref:Thioredoxin n=1 Tax=Dissophora globulifera TaxID=979702 RepID=A0A9P6RV37_9FUNG|nr:Thioredoxin [Dissophora globulifera]
MTDISLNRYVSSWCGPCKTIDPVIREAVASAGDVTLIRVNVDDCPKVSQEYQISSIPFVVALKDGKVVDKFVGAIPRPSIINFVKKHSSLA